MSNGIAFLSGSTAMAAWVVGLFFLRFWRRTGDPLFVWFALAFGLQGVSWIALTTTDPLSEFRPLLYVLRLIAFLLILCAIYQKNRAPSR